VSIEQTIRSMWSLAWAMWFGGMCLGFGVALWIFGGAP
jgi:hypothetical protein